MSFWSKNTFSALLATAVTATAFAEEPGFDCAKAQGSVEKLVCSDAALAALDRKLNEVYKAAMTKAGSANSASNLAAELRAEQGGWVKGRNECWKANGQPTWITATWTVSTVKDCVDAQYRLRTSELQSEWRLLPPRTVFYTCQNNPANEVVANVFDTDPTTIRLERGDTTVTLWRVGDASTGNYEGQNVSLVQQGNALKVNWYNIYTSETEVLQCSAR